MAEPDLEALREAVIQEGFARLMGIELVELGRGFAKVAMTVRQDMLNFMGLPHGGAIFALADTAFGAASNSHGARAVALNVNISYLAAAQPGERLQAEAQEEKLGRRTGLYTIRVTNAQGQLLAICQGLAYRQEPATKHSSS